MRTGDLSGLLAGERAGCLGPRGEALLGAVGRTGERSGLVHGDTLEDCGVRRCVGEVPGCRG